MNIGKLFLVWLLSHLIWYQYSVGMPWFECKIYASILVHSCFDLELTVALLLLTFVIPLIRDIDDLNWWILLVFVIDSFIPISHVVKIVQLVFNIQFYCVHTMKALNSVFLSLTQLLKSIFGTNSQFCSIPTWNMKFFLLYFPCTYVPSLKGNPIFGHAAFIRQKVRWHCTSYMISIFHIM